MDKACEPSEVMTFLGILFNTKNLTISVPPDKLANLSCLVKDWLLRCSTTIKDIKKLLGKLSSVAACVKASKIFINRILNWLRNCHASTSENELSSIPLEVKKDLFW